MTLHYFKRMGATVYKGSNAIDERTTIPSKMSANMSNSAL
jgi:hypothetical protein